MKPTNAYERKVVELSTTLTPLDDEDTKKIDRMFNDMECEAYFQNADEKGWNRSYGCRCGSPVAKIVRYYTRLDLVQGNVVIRTWQLNLTKKGLKGKPHQWFREVVRKWHGADGHAVESLAMQPFNYSTDNFVGRMELRSNYYNEDNPTRAMMAKYVEAKDANTRMMFKTIPSWLRKRGVTKGLFRNLVISRVIELASTNVGEYLIKCGHKRLFQLVCNRSISEDLVAKYLPALKIANRHHYTISYYKEYFDLLRLIDDNNGDWHSPKYICPTDFKAMHDYWVKVDIKRREKERKREERERILRLQEQYYQGRHMYFCVVFETKSKHLNFHVITSAEEMQEEGKHMHHCVAGYANLEHHPHSLIIGCRDKDGNRLATIEVNLESMTIVQIRGVRNEQPQYYSTIRKTISQHLTDIEDIKLGRVQAEAA